MSAKGRDGCEPRVVSGGSLGVCPARSPPRATGAHPQVGRANSPPTSPGPGSQRGRLRAALWTGNPLFIAGQVLPGPGGAAPRRSSELSVGKAPCRETQGHLLHCSRPPGLRFCLLLTQPPLLSASNSAKSSRL